MASADAPYDSDRNAAFQMARPLILALVVMTAALLGILLRPVGNLSSFWPANAILLGLLARHPSSAAARAGWPQRQASSPPTC
jgi:hypothetical protein